MKSIKYQQFRGSSPSSPRGPRSLSTCCEPNIFQNYDLPLIKDKSLMNNTTNSRFSQSPRKNKNFQQLFIDNPYFKPTKRERSYSNSTKYNHTHENISKYSINEQMIQTSPSFDKTDPILPFRMVYDNTTFNSNVVYGYSSFHSSLRQKKKTQPKQNHLNDYLEIKQMELQEKIKKYKDTLKENQSNNNNVYQSANNNQKGFFEITIFNYSNLNKSDFNQTFHHKQYNHKLIK